MSLYIASLNSGSNGNCYYIGNEKEAVLIDAGISCRETEKRMLRMGLSLKKVKAIFISHEHSDHIKGIATLSKKYNIPVYFTPQTLVQSRLGLNGELVRNFNARETVCVDGLTVTAFIKHHDAIDPHSFIVSGNGVTIGIFTDIGNPCEKLHHYFHQCHAAFLEANYDSAMLDKGRYPIYLKNRIRGGKGHLSNDQALQVFNTARSSRLSHLFLSHLSKDNNCPVMAAELFKKHARGVEVFVASRYEETGVHRINGNAADSYAMDFHSPLMRQPSLF